MRMGAALVFALFFALVLAPGAVRAESEPVGDPREAVREGIEAYSDGEYEFALARLRAAESAPGVEALAPEDRVLLHKYIAYCEIAFARRDEAKRAFLAALAIDPGLELDAGSVSPKILEVFREAKRESSAARDASGEGSPLAEGSSSLASAPRAEARRFRSGASLLVPGMPQVRRGEAGKGLALFSAGAASLAALAWLQHASMLADDYVRRAGPAERDDMKEQAAELRTLRTAAIAPVVLVWAFSAWDGSRAVAVRPTADGATVVVAWSF